MTAVNPDDLSSALEEIRKRHVSTDGSFQERWLRAQWDVPRLLAAVKAVLELCGEAQTWGSGNPEVLFFEKDIREIITRELSGGERGDGQR